MASTSFPPSTSYSSSFLWETNYRSRFFAYLKCVRNVFSAPEYTFRWHFFRHKTSLVRSFLTIENFSSKTLMCFKISHFSEKMTGFFQKSCQKWCEGLLFFLDSLGISGITDKNVFFRFFVQVSSSLPPSQKKIRKTFTFKKTHFAYLDNIWRVGLK